MKTIRLLYPDYLSGGLDTYYLGAQLLRLILPENPHQPLIQVVLSAPDGQQKSISHGIYAEQEVIKGIKLAQSQLDIENPDKIITLGGNCLVSLAPFDYLHGKYANVGIIWIDAHPDISIPEDGYPYAHAMVLGTLLGQGAKSLRQQLRNCSFQGKDILYLGLQSIHDYQKDHLGQCGVRYSIQDQHWLAKEEIKAFMNQYEHILVHFDIDVLNEVLFSSTYFANKELVGDGSGGGRMKLEELFDFLSLIDQEDKMVGLTIAEYLPFDAQRLQKGFAKLSFLTDKSI